MLDEPLLNKNLKYHNFFKFQVYSKFKQVFMAMSKGNHLISKLIRLVIGFRSSDVEDEVAIKDLKKLESICISFNILPNGFSQDPSVTPSRWTTIRSILYFSLMTVYITHLILLSVFDLPDEWLLVLGDFFYGHPNRRFFWLFCLNTSIFGEVLRHLWIFIVKKHYYASLQLQHSIYSEGFKREVLFMSQFYCQKFRFVATNLAALWVRIILCVSISLAPIFIFIVHSVSRLPKTSEQYVYIGFWLLVNYLGLVCTLVSIMLPGAVVTIQLSYFYFKASSVARTVQDLAMKRGKLSKVEYLLEYKTTLREIIQYQNEIEKLNLRIRNWLIFLYLGISFDTNFGAYIAVFVHIDRGFMDLFIAGISIIGLVSIGACSYTNGVILTKMISYCKNLRKATRCLQLNPKAFIKGTDLQSRLSRTDIAFTIGSLFDMTSRVFVIYLIENICLIMMFAVNLR
uniref:Gustatory receptor n=1 Tax=Tetranychus urticae TaxID=32264 RepID=T1KTD5_TETUR